MRDGKHETIMNCIVLGISIIFILLAPLLVAKSLKEIAEVPYLRPDSFPVFSLSMMALISAWSLFNTLVLKKRYVDEKADSDSKMSLLRLTVTLIILVLGWLSIQIIGLIAGTGLVTAALLIHFGVRDWKTILIMGGLMPLFIYLFFQVGLKIPLPEGMLFYSLFYD